MNLYIRIHDGQIIEHPIIEENLLQLQPGIDLNNLPPEYAKFVRVPKNVSEGVYEVSYVTYVWDNNIVTEQWQLRQMTQQEKTQKQQMVMDTWARNGFDSWIFNPETCQFDPPIPYPSDGNKYYWDESLQQWVPYNLS